MNTKEALKVIEKSLEECKLVRGGRHIVVLDRGWIFVGDLILEKEDVYILSNAKNVRKWETGGFGGLTKSAKNSGAVLDESEPLKFHKSAMIFCVPVKSGWGENE